MVAYLVLSYGVLHRQCSFASSSFVLSSDLEDFSVFTIFFDPELESQYEGLLNYY